MLRIMPIKMRMVRLNDSGNDKDNDTDIGKDKNVSGLEGLLPMFITPSKPLVNTFSSREGKTPTHRPTVY